MGFLIGLLNLLMISVFFLLCAVCAIVPLSHYFNDTTSLALISTWINEQSYSIYFAIYSVIFFSIGIFSIMFRIEKIRSFRMHNIIVKAKDGTNSEISNKAVTDFIYKIINSMEGIHQTEVKVYSQFKGTKIKVKIKLSIYEETTYPALNEQIQKIVRERVKLDLGINQISYISVSLDEIVSLEEYEEEYEEENFNTVPVAE